MRMAQRAIYLRLHVQMTYSLVASEIGNPTGGAGRRFARAWR